MSSGKYYSGDGGPDEVELAIVNKALELASWRRNVFITIETRCNVIGLVRVEPPGSSYWRPEGPLRGGLR